MNINLIKHKFKFYNNLNVDCNEFLNTILTLYNSSLNYLDINNIIINKYNFYKDNSQLYKDVRQYLYSRVYLQYLNEEYNNVIKRYDDPKLEERMTIRVELYKEGWPFHNIEKYIKKYFINNDNISSLNTDYYIYMYYNIGLLLDIKPKNINKKIGRPKLPNTVKIIIKEINKKKMRDNMSLKYNELKKFGNIKSCLLLDEEFNYIKNNIYNIDQSILNKLEKLKLSSLI
jgi:hypothetical protein